MIRNYLKNFIGDEGELAQRGVFNCMQIIEFARSGDMSYENFSGLDLRMYSLAGKKCDNTDFRNSYVDRSLLFFSSIVPSPESINFSPDGKSIVSVYRPRLSSQSSITIWDFSTGKLTHTFGDHKGKAFDAMYSPNGKHILALTHDPYPGIDKNWNNKDKYPKWATTSYGYTLYVEFARYSPDGKHIIVIERSSNKIEILDSNTGNQILVLDAVNPKATHLWSRLTSASICPNNKFIISSEHYQIYDEEFLELINKEYKEGWSMEVRGDSHSGRYWLIWGRDNNEKGFSFFREDDSAAKIIRKPPYEYHNIIKIWDMYGNFLYSIKDERKIIEDVSYSSDGKFIITKSTVGEFGEFYFIEIREKVTGKILHSFKSSPSSGGQNRASYSLHGNHIAITYGDEINIWEIETGTLIQNIKRTTGSFDRSFVKILYSPNGRYILSTSADNTTHIWSNKGELLRTLGSKSYTKDNIFYGNGELLTYCKVEMVTKVWDVNSGILKKTCYNQVSKNGKIKNIPYGMSNEELDSKRGNLIYSHMGRNYHTTRRLNFTAEDDIYLNSIAEEWNELSNDDKELIKKLEGWEYIKHNNMEISIWKQLTGELIKSIEVSTSEKNNIEFAVYSPDGNYIIVFCTEGNDENRKFFCYLKTYDSGTGVLINCINAGTYDAYAFLSVHQAYWCQNKKCIVSLRNGIIIILDIDKGIMAHKIQGDSSGGEYLSKHLSICCNLSETILASSNNDTIEVWDIETGERLKKIHYLYTSILGADLRCMKHDDLTEQDFLILKQNGAIVKRTEPSC